MILEINTRSSLTICEQLRNQIVLGIAAKKLIPGEPLPSVRSLAADLGINYHTVGKAYSSLCDQGYIIMDRRKGAVVADALPSGGEFVSNLSKTLLLSAAEAVCHDMDEEDFLELCTRQYKKAKGERL
ncbi:MAG: GntR family transcriptional regulator [Oscillospiraceae bacterium]|nr:GntR family transcriptional regulator [Oscillospiraceae bacterium]